MPAQVIFGDVREHDPTELKVALQEAGIARIDTAARYTNGESEKKIGRAKLAEDFTIDTKILYMPPDHVRLTPEAIDRSLSNSLNVMGVAKVNVLYCHAPDHETPVAVQARAFDEQYRMGRFDYLGVSNFPTSMVEEWLNVAEKEGYVKPYAYQGQYNLLCRAYEDGLFPLLRKHHVHFNAYSPLAGGFLLGNFTAEGVQGGSRFSNPGVFRNWYDKPSMHEAIKRLRKIGEETGIGMDELSLRWLVYHSILNGEDAIILGASKIHQIGKNVEQIRKGPLEEDVVRELNGLWERVKDEAKSIVEF